MNKQAETCNRRAADCERAAMLTGDESLRELYADLAKQWRDMAACVEHIENINSVVLDQR
jgi:hypothetical protein